MTITSRILHQTEFTDGKAIMDKIDNNCKLRIKY